MLNIYIYTRNLKIRDLDHFFQTLKRNKNTSHRLHELEGKLPNNGSAHVHLGTHVNFDAKQGSVEDDERHNEIVGARRQDHGLPYFFSNKGRSGILELHFCRLKLSPFSNGFIGCVSYFFHA